MYDLSMYHPADIVIDSGAMFSDVNRDREFVYNGDSERINTIADTRYPERLDTGRAAARAGPRFVRYYRAAHDIANSKYYFGNTHDIGYDIASTVVSSGRADSTTLTNTHAAAGTHPHVGFI